MAGRSSPSMSPMSWLQVQKTRSVSKKLGRQSVVNAVKKTKQTSSAGKKARFSGGADNQLFRGKTFNDLVLLCEFS